MKLKNGLEIISLERKTAQISCQSRFDPQAIRADENLQKRLEAIVSQANSYENETPSRDFVPQESDAIYVDFRALSSVVVAGHWLDWTREGVLEAAVPMLINQSVFPNHTYWDIYKALGSVSAASWDPTGEKFNGVPGINATYKIDAFMNPRIARGLLWKPPYIHSTSLTVLFEFEYSHPQLVEERRFWNLLGEEIDGEIVRLIVTKIVEIWEASLVFQGADRLAKQPKESDSSEDFDEMAAREPSNSTEVKKMKLSAEMKKKIGVEFDGEDVPETEILKAAESLAAKNAEFVGIDVAELQKKAAVADAFVEEKRSEVLRSAKLAELGSEEGELDAVVAETIKEASFERLQQLGTYFEKKVADRFPNGRSSVESQQEINNAGGVEGTAEPVKSISLHN